MKVYLDNCCYNRPFDDQSNIMNRMEADAKLFMQEQIKNGSIDLVWSSVNEFENNDNPSFEKRERIAVWKQIATERCNLNETILGKALELERVGLRSKDALHVACAIYVKADSVKIENFKKEIEPLIVAQNEFSREISTFIRNAH